MTAWHRPSWWIGLAALAIALFAVIVAGQWELEGRLFPWVIGLPVVGLALLHSVLGLIRPGPPPPAPDEGVPGGPGLLATRLRLFAWIGGLLLIMTLIGQHAGVPLFVFVFMLAHGEKWPLSAAMAVVLWGFIYGILDQTLRIHFPTPWLATLWSG
jgi:Tripartite tricarboxylate transporter TctB family